VHDESGKGQDTAAEFRNTRHSVGKEGSSYVPLDSRGIREVPVVNRRRQEPRVLPLDVAESGSLSGACKKRARIAQLVGHQLNDSAACDEGAGVWETAPLIRVITVRRE
jgi:hypothetical protein